MRAAVLGDLVNNQVMQQGADKILALKVGVAIKQAAAFIKVAEFADQAVAVDGYVYRQIIQRRAQIFSFYSFDKFINHLLLPLELQLARHTRQPPSLGLKFFYRYRLAV